MFKDLNRPYIIAEISGNHNGSLDRAKELIKLAKENGADCVKIQTYVIPMHIDQLTADVYYTNMGGPVA